MRPSGCRRSWRTPGPELGTVASDVLGVSGRAMLDALVSGTHDPAVLAELAKGRLRAKLPALREALAGRFRTHHALLLGELLAHLDYWRRPSSGSAPRSPGWSPPSRRCWPC